MFDDYPVKFLLDSEIEDVADETRRRLFGAHLPGCTIFEGLKRFEALKIIPQPDDLLGNYDAYVSVKPKRIFCKQSIYDEMRRGSSEACSVFAHELGHYVLHPAKEIRFLATNGNDAPFSIHPNESAERQAWLYADAFQMPSWAIRQVESATELAKLCNVTVDRAERRWHQVLEMRAAPKPQPKGSVEEDAWELAEQIRGEDPAVYRKAGVYRIARTEFKTMSHCGWFVRGGKAAAWIMLEQQWS